MLVSIHRVMMLFVVAVVLLRGKCRSCSRKRHNEREEQSSLLHVWFASGKGLSEFLKHEYTRESLKKMAL